MSGASIFIAVIIVIAIAVAVIYNQLFGKRQLARNGWSDIDVQLKRRADLIPQLVNTVKGYAAHERALFEEIATRRSAALAAGDDPAQRGAAEQALGRPLSRVVALPESYPDLKANENFLDLQRQLAETEDKIEMARGRLCSCPDVPALCDTLLRRALRANRTESGWVHAPAAWRSAVYATYRRVRRGC